MAITKISILNNNGTWTEAEPIGTDGNYITLKDVTHNGLGVTENVMSAIVTSADSGTAAWNKHNKLCDHVVRLDNHFDSAILSLSSAFDEHISILSSTFTSQMASLSSAFSSATVNFTGIVNEALPIMSNITIGVGDWNNLTYTITNNDFFQSSGYVYWISPVGVNYEGIYADNISTTGTIVFHCLTIPENYVNINMIRMKEAASASS